MLHNRNNKAHRPFVHNDRKKMNNPTNTTFRQYILDNILVPDKRERNKVGFLGNKTSTQTSVHYPSYYPCVPQYNYTLKKQVRHDEWMRYVSVTLQVAKHLRGMDFVKAVTNVDIHQRQTIRLTTSDMDMAKVKAALAFQGDHVDTENTWEYSGHGVHSLSINKEYPDLWGAIKEFKRICKSLRDHNLLNVCPCCWHGDKRTTVLTVHQACPTCVNAAHTIQRAWLRRHQKRSVAAACIQKRWRAAICDPRYSMCRSRLLKEFSDLSN